LGFSGSWCVYWLVMGPPPLVGLLESRLWRGSPARSLRNNDLEVKSLFVFHLAPFCCRFGLLGLVLLLRPGVGPPFRPDQKVKLDKGEATRGGPLLGCSPRGMTRVMLPAASRPTLAKNARMGHPLHSGASGKAGPPAKWMSGQAAALAARNDRRLWLNLTAVSTLQESSSSARRPPSPVDFYLSWMSPDFPCWSAAEAKPWPGCSLVSIKPSTTRLPKISIPTKSIPRRTIPELFIVSVHIISFVDT
jgi:hypothetical protein